MALSGSFQNLPYSSVGVIVEWSATQNPKANTSTISMKLYLQYWSISTTKKCWCAVENTLLPDGDGHTWSISDFSSGWKKTLILGPISKTVTHNSDGTKTVPLQGIIDLTGVTIDNWRGYKITASKTVTLDPIDRSKPAIKVNISDHGTNSISFSATASKTCTNWQYRLNGGSWTTFSTKSTTSISHTITGLEPGASYTLAIRATRTFNNVTGTSSTVSTATDGYGVILSAPASIDLTSATLSGVIDYRIFDPDCSYRLTVFSPDLGENLNVSTDLDQTVGVHSSLVDFSEIAESLIPRFPNSKSIDIEYTITSFLGDEQVSESVFPAVLSTSDSIAPDIDFSVTDQNQSAVAVTGDSGTFILGISTMVPEVTIETKYGATMSSAVLTVGKAQYDVSGAMPEIIPDTDGNVACVLSVTDSRGYNRSVTKYVKVYGYAAPVVEAASAARENSVGENTNLAAKGSVTDINGNNTLKKVSSRYKISGAEEFSAWEDTQVTQTSSDFILSISPLLSLPADSSYDLQVRFYDNFSFAERNLVVPSATPLVALRNKAVGINLNNPSCSLDIGGKSARPELAYNGIPLDDFYYPKFEQIGAIGNGVNMVSGYGITGSFNVYRWGDKYWFFWNFDLASDLPTTRGALTIGSFSTALRNILYGGDGSGPSRMLATTRMPCMCCDTNGVKAVAIILEVNPSGNRIVLFNSTVAGMRQVMGQGLCPTRERLVSLG